MMQGSYAGIMQTDGWNMSSHERKPCILVFAGPNGSGKSSVTKTQKIVGEYINADLIKEQKGCTDLEAAIEAEKLREYLLSHRMDFTFETVLSTSRNLLLLRRAKEAGYYIRVIFILTVDSSINVRRVEDRVRKGGHDVPEDKIRSRYIRSLQNLKELYKTVDDLWIYDNSGDYPCLIAVVQDCRLQYCKNTFWDKDAVLQLFEQE